MEPIFEDIQRSVESYSASVEEDSLRATKSLISSIVEFKKQLKAAEQTDRGITQRAARQLSEILSSLPVFRNAMLNENLQRLHNRRQAEDHLDKIEDYLKSTVEQLQQDGAEEINIWLKAHPVLSKLRHGLSKLSPKTTYILLFKAGESGEAQIITRDSEDGRVFTRFRTTDFKHPTQLYLTFRDEGSLVGAAVISNNELHKVIGQVPEAVEDKDQLRVLTSVSKDATRRPAKEFVAADSVLQGLHDSARERNWPKDAYALLFQRDLPEDEQPQWKIVTRQTEEAAVLTRFYSQQFVDTRTILENFKSKGTISGAAIIKDNELISTFGELPQPEGDEEQIATLVRLSSFAMGEPTRAFLSSNPVLEGLNQFANEENSKADAVVLLFGEGDKGRSIVLPTPRRQGKREHFGEYLEVGEFRDQRNVHRMFRDYPAVTGASIVGSIAAPVRATAPAGKGRDATPQERKVVLAAFGKTSLRKDILVTPEILKRLGIEIQLEEIGRAKKEPFRPNRPKFGRARDEGKRYSDRRSDKGRSDERGPGQVDDVAPEQAQKADNLEQDQRTNALESEQDANAIEQAHEANALEQ